MDKENYEFLLSSYKDTVQGLQCIIKNYKTDNQELRNQIAELTKKIQQLEVYIPHNRRKTDEKTTA